MTPYSLFLVYQHDVFSLKGERKYTGVLEKMELSLKTCFVFALLILSETSAIRGSVEVQEIAKSLSEDLKIYFEVIQNPTKGPTEECKQLKAPWGLCARTKVHLLYNGTQVVKNTDWKIFLHHIRLILKVDSDMFTVQHINGDLHYLKPTANFPGFHPGQRIEIPMIVEYWILSYSDIMPNSFVAVGCDAWSIKNSKEIDPEHGFCASISQENLRRAERDKSRIVDAGLRYDINKKSHLRKVPYHEIEGMVLPTPQKAEVGTESADLSHGVHFSGQIWDTFSENTKSAIYTRLTSYGVKIVVENIESANLVHQVILKELVSDQENKIDSYVLRVGKWETVVEGDMKGAFYGLQSFLSLITVGNMSMRTVNITDAARFRHRGIMVDVARNFKSKASILRLLDQMAYYKLNVLHFHLSDDEGWRLEISGLQELTEFGSKRCFDPAKCLLPQLGSGPSKDNQGSGFYSASDYEEIVRHANAQFIKVVPEVHMPSHSRAAVMSMEMRYLRYKEIDQTAAQEYRLLDPRDSTNFLSVENYDRTTVLNPCMPSTYNFVVKVISEIQRMHVKAEQPLTEWHFGGDVAHNIPLKDAYQGYNYSKSKQEPWQESEICRAAKADVKKLPFVFMKTIRSILTKHEIPDMCGWSDAAGRPPVPVKDLGGPVKLTLRDTLEWGAINRFQNLARAGFELVNSMPDFLNFEMPYEANPYERGCYWATRFIDLQKVFSFSPNCLPQNVEYSLTAMGLKYANMSIKSWPRIRGIPFAWSGMQGQLWSEKVRTDEQLEYMIFPRLVALAERAWHKASWEKSELECEGKTFGFGLNGKRLQIDTDEISKQYGIFVNLLGQRELIKLDKQNIKYRLPLPGYKIVNGYLDANVEIPSLKIQYSLDNGKKWQDFHSEAKPRIRKSDMLLLRTISKDGLRFRSEEKKCVFPWLRPEAICTEKTDGLYAMPNHRTKFIRCSSGKAKVEDCPNGFVFVNATKKCEYPQKKTICAEKKGVYPLPEQRSKYIHCLHGSAHIKDCPRGLVFLNVTKRCGYPETESKFCAERGNGFYRSPETCSRFVCCYSGRIFVFSCPGNLLYNEIKRFCDVPSKVKCP